jgi:hypothetical protein
MAKQAKIKCVALTSTITRRRILPSSVVMDKASKRQRRTWNGRIGNVFAIAELKMSSIINKIKIKYFDYIYYLLKFLIRLTSICVICDSHDQT